MLTQDTNHQIARSRTLTIPFYVAVSAVLLICALLIAGALVLSTTDNLEKSPRTILNEWSVNNGWDASKGVRIRAALAKLPGRYAASLGNAPDLPKLVIDIKFKDQEQLRVKRDQALALGVLVKEDGDLVPAEIRTEGRQVRVRVRLKGDQPDHLDSDKWSMRVEVKGDDHILGMRRFSLQHPKVRSYQAEPIFMETLRHLGVLGVRYQFVQVVINGEDKGIMALEEHFSKELLEHQARREGVFVRFDETSFWDFQRAGGAWRGSPYDNYRISRIDTFSSKKLAESPTLSAQYQVAAGLLRSFASGQVMASEVFDVDTVASYLAALELWGSWHSIQWNDIRFYFDPIAMKLQPIGYDANPQLHSDIKEVTLGREPIFVAMLEDPLVRSLYVKELRALCRDLTEGDLGTELISGQDEMVSILRHEFLFLEPLDLDDLFERARYLLELDDDELFRDPATYPRRIRFPALVQANLISGDSGRYLELANLLFEPVTITSIHWRNPQSGAVRKAETAEDHAVPFELKPTILGEAPEFRRLRLAGLAEAAGDDLVVTAKYANWPHEVEISPIPYYPEISSNAVPNSSIAELLSSHSFIRAGESEYELKIGQGHWTVDSDIVVPAGYTLSVEPGTTLEFTPGTALISYGALFLSGTESNPVTLKGIGSENWQGLVVMQAESKSVLRHVDILRTSGVGRGAWQLTGGVSFYKSDVDMEDVSISHHDGEDALNIILSHFDISGLAIADTLSDGFDADFTTGEIRDSEFSNIGRASGGDAVDISGSNISVKGIRFHNIADKAFSVGEGSRANASNLTMTRVGTAIASKDGSHLDVSGVVIDEIVFAGLMAYTKKPEYGPASIKADNVDFKPTGLVGRAQIGSVIELDGEELPTEDLDVDLLYETVMKKGS